jgi:hypothetical protein
VTRSVPSGRVYNRKKDKHRIGVESRDGFDADFLFCAKVNWIINTENKLLFCGLFLSEMAGILVFYKEISSIPTRFNQADRPRSD